MEKEMRAVLAKYPTLTMQGVNYPQGDSLLGPDALLQFELAIGCGTVREPKSQREAATGLSMRPKIGWTLIAATAR